MVIFRVHADHWTDIRDDVKAYSLEHWKSWEEEKPSWFDANFRAKVPDDFITREALDELNRRSIGGKRRMSSFGMLVEKEVEEAKVGEEVGNAAAHIVTSRALE